MVSFKILRAEFKVLIFLGLAIYLVGCAAKPTTFAWTSYEEVVYQDYSKPGSVQPADQIAKLEADYQKLQSTGKMIHPGFHAHLGFLYSKVGNFGEAVKHFQMEKKLFPESARLMDRFIQKLKKS